MDMFVIITRNLKVIIYNLDNTVRDGRLGFKISNGCIRLAKVNAKWIYDNIPYGTTVYIT